MIGAVVTSEDLVKTRTELVQWLREFGLESGRCSISLVTDSEDAVSDLVAGASEEFVFRVRKTAPQIMRHTALLERGVRKLREALQTLRADLNAEHLDVCFTHVGLSTALMYLCASLNRFSKAHGSELAPCDGGRKTHSEGTFELSSNQGLCVGTC